MKAKRRKMEGVRAEACPAGVGTSSLSTGVEGSRGVAEVRGGATTGGEEALGVPATGAAFGVEAVGEAFGVEAVGEAFGVEAVGEAFGVAVVGEPPSVGHDGLKVGV